MNKKQRIEKQASLFELVQLLQEAGHKCWQASDGVSVHFAGGVVTDEIKEKQKKIHIKWWSKDWEKKVLP